MDWGKTLVSNFAAFFGSGGSSRKNLRGAMAPGKIEKKGVWKLSPQQSCLTTPFFL